MAAVGSQLRFRNAFGTTVPERAYDGLRVALSAGQNLVRCNDKYWAVPWATSGGGGLSGSLYVHAVYRPGKIAQSPFLIRATSEQLLDFDFYPWEKTLVATAGRDGIVKVWKIPADGQLGMDLVAAEYYLAGHEKKVDLLKFHPTATDLLLTASTDLTLRLWDFREMREIQTLEGLEEPTVSMAWSLYGDTILQASKNGVIRLFDPRAQAAPVYTSATDFVAAKGVNVTFINDSRDYFTTGFSKSGDRQICRWDPRRPGAPVHTTVAGNSPGGLTPYMDMSLGILYVACKGEGLRMYEVSAQDGHLDFMTEIRTDRPQTAVGFLPKLVCDVDKCEIARVLKLCNDSAIQTVSVRVPRKLADGAFPDDLYPPTFADAPALTIDRWLKGQTVPPLLHSMRPEDVETIFNAPQAELVKKVPWSQASAAPAGSAAAAAGAPAAAADAPMTEGELELDVSTSTTPKWEKRWAAILSGRLHLFRDRDDATALASYALGDIVEATVISGSVVRVRPRTGAPLRLQAPSDADATRWCAALQRPAETPVPLAKASSGVRSSFSLAGLARLQTTLEPKDGPSTAPIGAAAAAGAGAAAVAGAARDHAGTVFHDGYVETVAEGAGWFGSLKWTRRFAVLHERMLYLYNDRPDHTSVPIQSIRLDAVLSVRPTDLNASYEGTPQAARTELVAFQVNTARAAIILRAPDVDAARDWVASIRKHATPVIAQRRRAEASAARARDMAGVLGDPSPARPAAAAAGPVADPSEADEAIAWEPIVEGYVVLDGQRQWLTVIGGDHFYFKSHLAMDVARTIKRADVDRAALAAQPGVNAFDVELKSGARLRHITRTDAQAQWWVRKLQAIHDLNFNLMDQLGLLAVLADKAAVAVLEAFAAERSVDLGKLAAGEQPMLVQLPPAQRPAVHVPTTAASLTADSAFVLDLGRALYVWQGPTSLRVTQARAADLANQVRVKERGGNAAVVFVNELAPRACEPFYRTLGLTGARAHLSEADLAGHTDHSVRSGTKLYRVANTKDPKQRLKVIFDEDDPDQLPSKQDRRLALLLAAQLGRQREAAGGVRVAITRILDSSETILFKEKFSDYPGSLTVHMQPLESPSPCYCTAPSDMVAPRREQPPIDIAALHAPTVWTEPTALEVPEGGEVTVWIMRQRLKSNNVNMDFEREAIPAAQYGQFYAGDSYIVQYRYQVKGRDRFALYFWQGRDSSITEKGAAAVETINVSDALGGDIPQIRVEQGKETRQFLRLFHVNGGMVVHLGDQAAPPSDAAVRLYQLRQAEHGDVRCIETDSPVLAFHSDHVTAVLTGTRTYAWVGKNASPSVVDALNRRTVLLASAEEPAIAVQEDKEPGEFIKLFTPKEWVDRPVGTRKLKSDVRLFLCSGASGVVTVERVLPFTQDDLDDHHVMILDAVTEVFAWFGARSTKPEKLIAMHTIQKLVVDSPRGHRKAAGQWVTFPFEEPIAFTRHFHVWSTTHFSAEQRAKPKTFLPVDTVLAQYERRVFSYEALVAKEVPDTVDKTKLEDYLSDEDFVRVLGVTRADFSALPAWRQSSLKQKSRLY